MLLTSLACSCASNSLMWHDRACPPCRDAHMQVLRLEGSSSRDVQAAGGNGAPGNLSLNQTLEVGA